MPHPYVSYGLTQTDKGWHGMTMVDTMPVMDSTSIDGPRLVGWIVRDGIINEGMTFTDASRRWPIALPTLNRLMNTGSVSLRFYRVAEKNLGLPHKLLDHVADGNTAAIRAIPQMDENLRTLILRELGGEPPRSNGQREKRR